MTDYVTAWQCTGCGRLEAAQPCVGVCQDRRVRLVSAEDYDAAAERARLGEGALALARRLARTQPRGERWRESFEAFREEAERIVAEARELEDAIAEAQSRSGA
jgi:hypothetical protein